MVFTLIESVISFSFRKSVMCKTGFTTVFSVEIVGREE